MDYEILQMEIVPLNAVAVNAASVANGGREVQVNNGPFVAR